MESLFKYVNDLWRCNGFININYVIIIYCFLNGKLLVYILLVEILKCK